jgi:hypothetical protein
LAFIVRKRGFDPMISWNKRIQSRLAGLCEIAQSKRRMV